MFIRVMGVLQDLKSLCALLCVCLVLFLLTSPVFCLSSDESDASLAIAAAEQRVDVCYLALVDAQKAGANVTDLLWVLDGAGILLSRARLAFETGHFDTAYSLAVQSRGSLDGFDLQAGSLRDDAARQEFGDFVVNVVVSSVAAVAVLVGGFLFWFLSKRKHESSGGVVG